MNKCSWKGKSSKTEKPWGHETVWSALPGVQGKILFIKAGNKTSLKYNNAKDEILYILSGKVLIQYGDQSTLVENSENSYRFSEFTPGGVLHIQSCSPYRITAIEDSEIIEIGNNKKSTCTRIDDDYGRACK